MGIGNEEWRKRNVKEVGREKERTQSIGKGVQLSSIFFAYSIVTGWEEMRKGRGGKIDGERKRNEWKQVHSWYEIGDERGEDKRIEFIYYLHPAPSVLYL